MMALKTLHILNKSPAHSRFQLCLSAVGPEDGLLLIENGVLAATQAPEDLHTPEQAQCFALGPDLEARGLTAYAGKAQSVSFEQMVELTATAENVISW
jgi:tRNA 2-thiouridine synthesizing protein B